MAIPPYTAGQPADGEKLGVSKVPIRNNIDALAQTIAVDHIALDLGGQGKHKFVRMPVGASTIPASLVNGEGTLYTKTVGTSQLFYTPDDSGDEYQLTRTIAGSFSGFSTNIAYGTPPATFTQQGGWSFLPGGMLLQYGFYGKVGATGSSGTIQFPVTWTTGAFSIQLSIYRNSGNQTVSIDTGTAPTTTSFKFLTSSSGSNGIYWFAVGK
jgi:hypothetical protein